MMVSDFSTGSFCYVSSEGNSEQELAKNLDGCPLCWLHGASTFGIFAATNNFISTGTATAKQHSFLIGFTKQILQNGMRNL